jgi:exonuclease III
VLGDIDDVYNAVNVYRRFITSCETMIIGDFNSNPSFCKIGRHIEVVNILKGMNIVSVYHERNKKEHGEEVQPTYYQHYHSDKPSHIDYCFLPIHLANKVTYFEIGDFDTWIKTKLSDHSPIFMELEL